MPVTEGVVHLGDDGLGRAIRSTADPEAHGLKGETGESRQTAEPDLTITGVNAMRSKLLLGPVEQRHSIAMVSILNIDEGRAV